MTESSLSPSRPVFGLEGETSLPLDDLKLPDILKPIFDPVYGERYSSKFLVGSQNYLLYGNPPAMSTRSRLIMSNLSLMLEAKEPYDLASGIRVQYLKSLMSAWSYVCSAKLWVSGLTTAEEQLDVWNWLNYFDVPLNDNAIVIDWMGYIMKNVNSSKLSPNLFAVMTKILNARLENALFMDLKEVSQETFQGINDMKMNVDYTEMTVYRAKEIHGVYELKSIYRKHPLIVNKSNKQKMIQQITSQGFTHFDNTYTTSLDPVFIDEEKNLYVSYARPGIEFAGLYPLSYIPPGKVVKSVPLLNLDTLVTPTDKGFKYHSGVEHKGVEYYKQVGDRLEPFTGMRADVYDSSTFGVESKLVDTFMVNSVVRWKGLSGAVGKYELSKFGFSPSLESSLKLVKNGVTYQAPYSENVEVLTLYAMA